MATVQRKRLSGRKLVLYGIPWSMYEQLLRVFEEKRRLRITYDRGALEIMTLSLKHERSKHLLGQLIVILAVEVVVAIAGFGSMTFKRRRKQRGLEPDECYWIRNEALMRDKDAYDVDSDPPPDLVLEIDIFASSLKRMAIYAALKVLEVWRWDGEKLQVHVLRPDGKYEIVERGCAFPFLKPADLVPFLALAAKVGETETLRVFRDWVNGRIANNSSEPAPPIPSNGQQA